MGAVKTYTFTNVTASHTIAATFKLKSSGGGGGGGGGGCSLAGGPASSGGALGWTLPYLAMGAAWVLARVRTRKGRG